LLADRIGGQRGRTSGTVAVNSRHAESSLLSFAHLAFTDRRRGLSPRIPGEARTAAAGFYPTKDQRWVYLHSGFPHNTAGLLDLLGVEDDGPAVSGAIAGWEAQDLEDAIARAGLCGAMVRSAQEWDASPAGRLLAARPVVELIQLDDSPPEPFPAAGDRPLAGIKVLDLTRILAGPTCARTLASYGAQVLRVGAAHLPAIPLFAVDTGFGKRACYLDLGNQSDADRLRNLVGEADVFSQGYRSGAMERLGFSVSEVVRQRPGIVYVSINCYGHEGAWRARPGWEQLAQTVTGMAATQGAHLALDQPTLLPAAVNDYITGYLAAFGTLAALARRASHGGSYWVRVSLSRTAVWVRSLALRRAVTARPMTEQELSAASGDMESAWGPLRYLTPAVSLTSTDVGWQRPPSPLGSDEPVFVT
jgi:crotonobetainyl-CoA:carnitine CoA-transferase CaiB-like acyl-CoA transferase